ncbi:MAG TPA: thioredoxin family protein [Phycisphaerae bacterium]|nr:thioredoxin family protein [Phycisphaerae bacterium]
MPTSPRQDREAPVSVPPSAEPARGGSCPLPGCGSRSWVLWLLLIIAALVYFNSSRASSVPSAVAWDTDIEAALAKARQARRPVLLKFHATWCGPCREMEREVYSRKDVGDTLKSWINVSIDGDEHPKVLDRYNVDVVPTLVMLDSDGKELFRYVGYMSAEELTKTIKAIDKTLTPPEEAGT